jgi:ABC-type siderophore export system fused ATPase/permease subunit
MTLVWTSPTAGNRFGGDRFRFIAALLGRQNRFRGQLLAWLAVATFSTMAIVALIGTMAEQGFNEAVDLQKLGLFTLIAGLVVFSQYKALMLTTTVCDQLAERSRHDVLRALRSGRLDAVEAIGTARISATVDRVSAVCLEAGPAVIHGIIALGVILLIAAHLTLTSPFTSAVILFFGSGTLWLYRHFAAPARDDQERAEDAERRYQSLFVRFLDNIRQVKLDRRLADNLELGHLAAASADWSARRAQVAQRLNGAAALLFAGCYLILAAAVFAMPQYVGGGSMAVKITYVTIFMLATFNILARAAPALRRATAALKDLDLLQATLAADGGSASVGEPSRESPFRTIEARDLMARHAGERSLSFRIGPGDILAIEGANGSGKTALVRALTGLDPAAGGCVILNGQVADPTQSEIYRSQFALALHDDPPADRLYGSPDVSAEQLEALLTRLGLDVARIVSDGRLDCDDLSPALRQRIVLALALLRDRPVLVLDDIVRAQDRAFRDTLVAVLREKAAAGTAIVLMVTDGQWARQLTQNVVVLDESARFRVA